MKLTAKVLGIMTLTVVVSAVFLFLNLRQFDALYRDRARHATELSAQILQARVIQLNFKKQVQEWKDILLRGRNPADLEKYRANFKKEEEEVSRGVQDLLSKVQDGDTRRQIEDFNSAHRTLGEAYRSSLAAYLDTFDLFASDRLVRGLDRRPTDLLDGVVSTLEKRLDSTRVAHIQLWDRQWQWASSTSALFFLLFLIIMGFLCASIARPIVSLARIMRRGGNEAPPSMSLASDRKDEIGELFAAFDQMQRTARERDQALLEDRNALADREARLRSFTQSVSDGIVSTDASGTVLAWNEAASEMLGYSPEEILGKPLLLLIPAHDQRRMTDTMNRLLEPGEAGPRAHRAKLEVDGLRKDGSPVRLEVSLASWQNGPSTYLGAILRDVTEQRKVETLKDEFVSTVNHELRTPLTAIRGSLGLLAGGIFPNLPAPAKSMIELAHKNCERLSRLVNDILDVEKIESGKVSWVAKPNDVGALVRQSLELNRAFGDQAGVSLTLGDCPEGANILVDPDRFNQVMSNLLSNAIKFSPRGQSVRVSVAKQDGRVRVEVRDSGPGIPDEFRRRIFQKFAQAETSDARVRQGQGTGLGLAITKAIVERMKGSIGFDTQLGGGTTFFFTLPLIVEHATFKRALPGPYAVVYGVDGAFAKAATEALQGCGISAATPTNPDMLLDVVSDPRCRAVFVGASLDRGLISPWLSKDEGKPKAKLFLVGQPGDRTPTRVPGGTGISSSLSASDLGSLLHRELSPLDERLARVLHLEPDAAEREKVKETLRPLARIVTAATVEEAWQLLRREPLDLMILDLHLKDGCSLDLLLTLRGFGREGLPVVMRSDSAMPKRMPAAVKATLSKSRTSAEQLVATVRSLISGSEPAPESKSKLPAVKGENLLPVGTKSGTT